MAAIKKAYGSQFDHLEIVEAELLEEESMMKAIEGSTYVAHLASPYYLDNKTRDELVAPAVNGTLGVMKACSFWGVKRCVFTSSFACIRWTAKEDAPSDGVYNEDYWSNPDRPEGMGDYAASKVLAEKAGWDYQSADSNPFEIVTICPTLILGPGIGNANVVSEEFISSILNDTTPSIKCASNFYVDVREVARAHYLAIKVPDAKNKRFMLSGENATKENIRDMLKRNFESKGFKPGCDTIDDAGAVGIVNDNSASKNILGVEYRPLETTLTDMVNEMIAAGKVTGSAGDAPKSWWSKLFG